MNENLTPNPEEKLSPELRAFKENFGRKIPDLIELDQTQLEPESEDVVPVETALMEMDEEIFIDLPPDKKDIILSVITEQLGLDLNTKPIREFIMEGTPGTEAQGEIKVSCYKTNQPGISVRRLKYEDGDISWAIGR